MRTTQSRSRFPTTCWTVVLQLRDQADSAAAKRALAELCRGYWYPLYAFARRHGARREEAQDLTQGFFAQAIARDFFAAASPELGRLRTFLLTAFKRFIGDARDREHAFKRGGGSELLSLDAAEGEARYARELADETTPERLFERAWALAVVEQALAVLAHAEEAAGRGGSLRVLDPFLSPASAGSGDVAAAARALGTTEENVRQLVSRLRRRFRDTLRQHLADTLRTPTEAQIDAELVALRAALRQ